MAVFVLTFFAAFHLGFATIALDDQVSLLQAELAAKAEEKQDSFVIGDDEDYSCPLSAEGLSRPNTPCAESRGKDKGALLQTGVVFPDEPSMIGTSAQQADKTEGKEADGMAPRALGYLLDLLVFLVICDGVRRWRKKVPLSEKKSSKSSACVDGWQGFMKAAMEGDAQRCEMLLVDGVDLFRTDVWGCTVLHAAARGGLALLVDTLLEQGAKIDAIDAWDETPLHLAARAGHTDVCNLLVERGAPANALNAQDWTPLVVSAHEGKEDTCKALLDRGAGAGDLAEKDLPPMLNSLLLQKVIAGACSAPLKKTAAHEDELAMMEQEALQKEQEEFTEQFNTDD